MDEYISRPSLMGQLTCSEAQSSVREMTGEEVYAWVLELVNRIPAEDVFPMDRCDECRAYDDVTFIDEEEEEW